MAGLEEPKTPSRPPSRSYGTTDPGLRHKDSFRMDRMDGLATDQASRSTHSDSSSHESAQAGVKKLEAVSATWSKWGLLSAYLGLALTPSLGAFLSW